MTSNDSSQTLVFKHVPAGRRGACACKQGQTYIRCVYARIFQISRTTIIPALNVEKMKYQLLQVMFLWVGRGNVTLEGGRRLKKVGNDCCTVMQKTTYTSTWDPNTAGLVQFTAVMCETWKGKGKWKIHTAAAQSWTQNFQHGTTAFSLKASEWTVHLPTNLRRFIIEKRDSYIISILFNISVNDQPIHTLFSDTHSGILAMQYLCRLLGENVVEWKTGDVEKYIEEQIVFIQFYVLDHYAKA
jgi:hypothetical protein